jgi:hypothetical protein
LAAPRLRSFVKIWQRRSLGLLHRLRGHPAVSLVRYPGFGSMVSIEPVGPGMPALSDGSHHPDWFHKVVGRFIGAVSAMSGGAGHAEANLAEASLCCEIEHLARESSRRGGVPLPLSPASLAGSRR